MIAMGSYTISGRWFLKLGLGVPVVSFSRLGTKLSPNDTMHI